MCPCQEYSISARARQELEDICKCNDFKYFVTLTFDQLKISRLDDNETRKAFTRWVEYIKRKYPNMYYVCSPEYHKKGGLHFHLLIGGIEFDALKPEFWKKQTKGKNKGQDIYNITAWDLGHSTMTIINEQQATKHYICKYITKQNLDERFFGKKRYYVSRNIVRPLVQKETIPRDYINMWDIDYNRYNIAYFNQDKQYGIFTLETENPATSHQRGIEPTMRKRQLLRKYIVKSLILFGRCDKILL